MTRFLILLLLLTAAGVGIWFYYNQYSLNEQNRKLREEVKQLELIAQRLTAERRVAEILVTGRKMVGGIMETRLLFVEYGRGQKPLPAKEFTVRGDKVHVDGLVIKFEREFVRQDDPLRGKSIVLFTRIYGENEKPAEAQAIDPPQQAPDYYKGADAHVGAYEAGLWKDFWRLYEDAEFRASKGVRIANGQGVWGPFQPDRLYTLTLEADGGLNLSSEAIKPIYREAIKNRQTN